MNQFNKARLRPRPNSPLLKDTNYRENPKNDQLNGSRNLISRTNALRHAKMDKLNSIDSISESASDSSELGEG